jgi:hypothetical protein
VWDEGLSHSNEHVSKKITAHPQLNLGTEWTSGVNIWRHRAARVPTKHILPANLVKLQWIARTASSRQQSLPIVRTILLTHV